MKYIKLLDKLLGLLQFVRVLLLQALNLLVNQVLDDGGKAFAIVGGQEFKAVPGNIINPKANGRSFLLLVSLLQFRWHLSILIARDKAPQL